MNKKNLILIAALGAVLVACSEIPKEAYYSRGQPQDLLSTSSEKVDFRIESPASVEDITKWINRDQPTRAELTCYRGDGLCGEVDSVLRQFGVPVKYVSQPANKLSLVYEKTQVRNCESRYIDNAINPYNLNHPTFGCSLSVNMVQMVTDKREFTDPALMDYPDAIKAGQVMGFYNTPSSFVPPKVDANFSPIVTQEILQTQGLTGGR